MNAPIIQLSFGFILAAHVFAIACGFIGGYLIGRGSALKSMEKKK